MFFADQLSLFDPPTESPAPKPSTSLQTAVATWIDHLRKKDTSKHTLQAFTLDVKLLVEYVEPELTLNQITTARINQFLNWMRTERGVPCSDKTYGRRVTSIKAFFRWVTPVAGLRLDPAEAVLQLSVRSPLPEMLTDDDVEKCLNAGEILRRGEKPDMRPLLIFKLLLETAMKKVEVANLKLEHIHQEDGILEVRYPKKKDWPKERKLKISREWLELFSEYRAEYAPKEAVFKWSTRNLEFLLGDTGRAAGLEKNVSFDMMRWTSAVRDYKTKVDPDAIRRKMGLSTIQWRETFDRIKKLTEKYS